jgi:hypothetical protein
MPLAIERAVKAAARRKGLKPGTKAWDRYVWGTMNKIKKKRGRIK